MEDRLLCTWLAVLDSRPRSCLRNIRLDSKLSDVQDPDAYTSKCRSALKEANVQVDGAALWVEVYRAELGDRHWTPVDALPSSARSGSSTDE